MEKQDNYSEMAENSRNFATNLEYSSQNQMFNHARQSESFEQQQKWQQQQQNMMFEPNNIMTSEIPPVDRTLSFADVMQFADFGPKLGLNQNQNVDTDNVIIDTDDNRAVVDPVYFLKFPVLSHNNNTNNGSSNNPEANLFSFNDNQEEETENCEYNNPIQLEFLGNNTDENVIDISGDKINEGENAQGGVAGKSTGSSKRKRPRSVKTTEEVESQRMTHIAVERNRRKQMNEHLRVLRSLMPSSYVQRGDQASIIGGAIEFVRELEQLLQCLESQKRRRLYGDQPPPTRPTSPSTIGVVPQQPLGFPPPLPRPGNQFEDNNQPTMDTIGANLLLEEDFAESKSCIADVEVKVLGFDALIKILSRRRPGQLLKVIASLEDLQLTILHTNITTIEQTVLYAFNVKVASETRFTADDIASSIQQIFTFIHANNTDITI